jgi:gamma-glutamyltranspeptidase/glutathione hydrolase
MLRGLLLAGLAVVPAFSGAALPDRAAVASAHPLASDAGIEVMAAGGNAFDAAVAVSAALSVVEPYSSGLGGGAFFLLHRAADGFEIMIDGRETAPAAATADMYLDAAGDPIPRSSRDGPLAAGIPGLPAALVHMAEHYGRLPLAASLAPAIRLAREGFRVDPEFSERVAQKRDVIARWPAATELVLRAGAPPVPGSLLRQADLAVTLQRLADQGHAGFYRGATAQALVRGVREAGGIWSEQDLADYRVVERAPLVGQYRGMRVVTAPPPSSGGVALIDMLNMLSGYELPSLAPPLREHLLIEVMRRAYRDRALYLGDPDFVAMPVDQLVHPFYAAGGRHQPFLRTGSGRQCRCHDSVHQFFLREWVHRARHRCLAQQ